MSRTGRNLRSTSDQLMRDLDALLTLENEKRQLVPGDPRMVPLAADIATIAGRVLGATRNQLELTQHAEALVAAGHPDAPVVPVAETPRAIPDILADWREAERRMAELPEGSHEADEARRDVERLRSEYRAASESNA